jgi:hypothetical protein
MLFPGLAKISGRSTEFKETNDFFPTDPVATLKLLAVERFTGDIFDPCAGDGAILQVFATHGFTTTGADIRDYGGGYPIANFLEYPDDHAVDNVVTNPPYALFDAFLAKALRIARRKVVFLYSLQNLGQLRRSRQWTGAGGVRPNAIRVLTPCIKVNGKRSSWSHCWISFDKENPAAKTEFDWLLPELLDPKP